MERTSRRIIGVDLSGPTNIANTVLVAFDAFSGGLRLTNVIDGAGDEAIWRFVYDTEPGIPVSIGLDAPLSYQPGGGDRPGDAALRRAAIAAGLPPGSIMPPTLNRMSYLTLRGISVARGLRLSDGSAPSIVEVHPGAVMAVGGAPIDDVRSFVHHAGARKRLLNWLESQAVTGIDRSDSPSDHYVAACAAALGAWKWSDGRSSWRWPSDPPTHPFEFVA
jgi:predicted nuclease with RNAse H fold